MEVMGTDHDHKQFGKRNLTPRYVYSGVVLRCEMCLTLGVKYLIVHNLVHSHHILSLLYTYLKMRFDTSI
jgi:hypothetical protein